MYPNKGKKWFQSEDDQLWIEYKMNKDVNEISSIHGRSKNAIELRIMKLKDEKEKSIRLSLPPTKIQDDDETESEEEDEIYDLYKHLIVSGVSLEEICSLFHWQPRQQREPRQPKQIDRVLHAYILKNPNNDLAKQKLYDSLIGLNLSKNQYECNICMTNNISVAFQCGHTTCKDCATKMETCHQCRNTIKTKIELYFN